jgi:hypothetical protein
MLKKKEIAFLGLGANSQDTQGAAMAAWHRANSKKKRNKKNG